MIILGTFTHLKYINEKLLNPDNSNNYWKRSANLQHFKFDVVLYNTLGVLTTPPLIKIIFLYSGFANEHYWNNFKIQW